jgi:hypothetical protein
VGDSFKLDATILIDINPDHRIQYISTYHIKNGEVVSSFRPSCSVDIIPCFSSY